MNLFSTNSVGLKYANVQQKPVLDYLKIFHFLLFVFHVPVVN